MAEHILTPDTPQWGEFGIGWRSRRLEKESGISFDAENLCAKVYTDRRGRLVKIDLYRRKPFEFLGRIEAGDTARKDARRGLKHRKVML